MNKSMLQILSSLGTVGLLALGGRLLYKKGQKDQAKKLKNDFEILQLGMDMGSKNSKETK